MIDDFFGFFLLIFGAAAGMMANINNPVVCALYQLMIVICVCTLWLGTGGEE